VILVVVGPVAGAVVLAAAADEVVVEAVVEAVVEVEVVVAAVVGPDLLDGELHAASKTSSTVKTQGWLADRLIGLPTPQPPPLAVEPVGAGGTASAPLTRVRWYPPVQGNARRAEHLRSFFTESGGSTL
jgi:hypothetical protein